MRLLAFTAGIRGLFSSFLNAWSVKKEWRNWGCSVCAGESERQLSPTPEKPLSTEVGIRRDTQHPFVKSTEMCCWGRSQNSFGGAFSVCFCQGCCQHLQPVCRRQSVLTGPQGTAPAPQLVTAKSSQMCLLSRLVKLNEVFKTVISCSEFKIAILSKFIELYGFAIPESLLFLVFISCAQHQQNCHKCLNFIMELSWQEALGFSGQEKVLQPQGLSSAGVKKVIVQSGCPKRSCCLAPSWIFSVHLSCRSFSNDFTLLLRFYICI